MPDGESRLSDEKQAEASLPEPSPEQRQNSELLTEHLIGQILTNGALPFADFMRQCLYTPGMGYYVNGFEKIGSGGDFTTAPQISDDFAACLARQCAQWPDLLRSGVILEFGGGNGRLARDLLRHLQKLDCLPGAYLILDVSADLREEQRRSLAKLAPHLRDRVQWLDRLPTRLDGIVVANELFDAFAVERFHVQAGQVRQVRVALTPGNQFCSELVVDTAVSAYVEQLQVDCGRLFGGDYRSEFCPTLLPWWRSLADCLGRGVVLAVDYGMERQSYYSAHRATGSLRCFYRHRVHSDPLVLPGIQDITADVDFTAVVEAAVGAGFELQGYAPLAQCLLSLGALQQHENRRSDHDLRTQVKASGRLKRLLLPEEMGERFKLIAFSKGIDEAMAAFDLADHSRLL